MLVDRSPPKRTQSPIERTRARLTRLLGSLQRFGEECELAGPGSTYVFAGWSLLNQRLVEENPELLQRVIREDGKVEAVVLPFSAREVYFKTHARILGLHAAPNMTAKLLGPGESLRAERIARLALADKLAASRHVRMPKLYRYGRGGQWLVEELVEAEQATPADLRTFLTDGGASDFYAASARFRPVGQRPTTAALLQELAELDPSFPRIGEDASLPVAVIHGDLGSHNLMRTPDGRFCIFDLDKARVAPVAADMVRIFRRRPGLRGTISDFLRSMDPTGQAMSPELQLALGVVYRSRPQRKLGNEMMRRIETRGVQQILAALRPAGA